MAESCKTYDVLIQSQAGGMFRAIVLGWPDLSAVGDSEQMAVERIRRAIRERLAQGKVVRVEVDQEVVEASTAAQPWTPFLGMWQNDPTFDDFAGQVEQYRRELDEAPTP